MCGQAPLPLSLPRSEATRPFATTTALVDAYLFIRLTITRGALQQGRLSGPPPQSRYTAAARRGPAPPAPPRRYHPCPAAARCGHPEPTPGLRSTPAPTPPALPAAGPPASAPLDRLRPAGLVGQRRRASGGPQQPGIQGLL